MRTRGGMAGGKQGYVLLLALVFTGLLAMGSALLLKISSQKAFTERRQANRTRALMVAEAGAHQAFAMYHGDTSLADQPFPDIHVNGGVSSITFSDANTGGASLNSVAGGSTRDIILRSSGLFAGEQAEVALLIRQSAGGGGVETDPVVLELFDGAIFCGGDARMNGASYIDLGGGTAHVNGKITMTGSAQFRNGSFISSSTGLYLSGYPQIWADVAVPFAPKPPWGSLSTFIHGSVAVGAVPPQMIEIDLEPFRQFALATDIPGMDYKKSPAWNYQYTDSYFSADEMPNNGKLVISGSSEKRVVPPGGVLWVEGSIKFAGSVNIHACVIATGDIEVVGGTKHLQPGGLPSFVSLNGDVLIGAGCIVYGLVYAHNGDIRITGNATVEGGAFICPRGDFDHQGSGKVHYNNSRPYGPNGEIVMLPKSEPGSAGGPPSIVGWIK